jgi:hypothetical protein
MLYVFVKSESNGSGGWFVCIYKKCDKKAHNSTKEHLNVKKKKRTKKERTEKRKTNRRRRDSKPRHSGSNS